MNSFNYFDNIGNDQQNFNGSPAINIILVIPSSNFYSNANYYNNQSITPPLYNYFNAPNRLPIISQQPQLYQQPQFYQQPIFPHQPFSDDSKKKIHKHKSKSKKKTKHDTKEKKEINCPEGIFKYFFDQNVNGPISMGLVEVLGNSYNESWKSELPNIIRPTFRSYWLPEKKIERYFIINFKTFSVKISKYRIRVGDEGGRFIFKSWILTGTDKNGDEIILDNVNNCSQITRQNPVAVIEINSKIYVSSIKLSMKGRNENGDLTVDMGNIEFYGSIKYDK